MRLIDADRLSEAIYDNVPAPYEDAVCAKEDCLTEVYAAPTVDAVPVVRCKDCVNGTVFVNKQGAEYVDCVLDDYSVRKPTDYCSYGKRKEGADNG